MHTYVWCESFMEEEIYLPLRIKSTSQWAKVKYIRITNLKVNEKKSYIKRWIFNLELNNWSFYTSILPCIYNLIIFTRSILDIFSCHTRTLPQAHSLLCSWKNVLGNGESRKKTTRKVQHAKAAGNIQDLHSMWTVFSLSYSDQKENPFISGADNSLHF